MYFNEKSKSWGNNKYVNQNSSDNFNGKSKGIIPIKCIYENKKYDIMWGNDVSLVSGYVPSRSTVPLRRICKKDCEILENELCQKEYSIAKRHPHIG